MAGSDRGYDFDFYSLFADERYSEFEVDRYTFNAEIDLKEAHYFDYDTHDMLPYILAREVENGDNKLEDMLGITNVDSLYSEGEEVGTLIAEDWILEGDESIAVGQACSCRYKPLKGGVPHDIRQAFWFHRQFEQSSGYLGEKELRPPHTVSVDKMPSEAGGKSFEGELEVIVRTLEPEIKEDITASEKVPIPDVFEDQRHTASD
jgi:hypothetical protein